MRFITIKLPAVFLLLASLATLSVQAQQVSLKIAGDHQNGFTVDVCYGTQMVVTSTEEFSLQLYNQDLSAKVNMEHFTGENWTSDVNGITLSRKIYVKEFDTDLSVSINYLVVNASVIKKTIRLFQTSMPGLYYILKQTARPVQMPVQYVTFENEKFPGGFVHEMYPAAGFITRDNILIGFLTDAGYKNQFTRNTRRRFSGRDEGFTGLRRLPDINLVEVSSINQQAKKNHFIRQTFGEVYNLDAGESKVLYAGKSIKKIANSLIRKDKGVLSLSGHGQMGVELIAPFRDQQIYTLSFWCKGNKPLAVKLFRMKNGKKSGELEDGLKYVDNVIVNNKTWTLFERSILVPYTGNDSISLFISSRSEKQSDFKIKDLKFKEHRPVSEPFNIIHIGDTVSKTTYIFVEPWQSHQQFMISAQSHLAEGKGFKGSLIEKMLYANFNMLTWITDVNNFSPFNVPDMNYSPDMYNRDSFFSTVSTYNKGLNIAIWEQWGKTQTTKGSIGTIVTPMMGSIEAKDNEATIDWLIWAMLNKRRFCVDPPRDKIKKAVDYVLNEFDADRDGKCKSHFSLSQIDVIDYEPKTDRLAVNQGMLVIALKTIKELGFDLSDNYIRLAENEYRNFYDAKEKHMLFDKDFPDIISITDLEPEFFSLWLFNEPILTDEMVKNHLDQIPVLNKVAGSPHPDLGTTATILIRLTDHAPGYAYLSAAYQPFGKFGAENYTDGKNDGYYCNGGSWLRPEYCAYVVGLKHGWVKALPLMENRTWAEIYLNPKWPFSREFTPTKWTTTDGWWPSTKGLCWNIFILMADEVAGLRTPDMDPDFNK